MRVAKAESTSSCLMKWTWRRRLSVKWVARSKNITYLVRAANKKTFREIHHEIRIAQVEAVEKAWEGFKAM
jgi:hypothetical protein